VISILIGSTDHSWSFVKDQIIYGNGPTAQQSKLSYLLSGPVPSIQLSALIFLQLTTITEQSPTPNIDQLREVEVVGMHPPEFNFTLLHVWLMNESLLLPGMSCITHWAGEQLNLGI